MKEQKEPITNEQINTEDLQLLTKYIDTLKSNEMNDSNNSSDSVDVYKQITDIINNIFPTRSRLYISKNLLTYTRLTKNICFNHIIGHSPGSDFRDQEVNKSPSTYNSERIMKLKPEIISSHNVYYFDFGCSAGYDHDEISRPDFVYSTQSGLFVSNLPALSFITNNENNSLLVMKDKTPRSPNRIIINNN